MSGPRIILDKNFVQGGTKEAIGELCASGQALMPDVLFYEMLSDDEPWRTRCFVKFPGVNPVPIVPSVSEMLAIECETHEPCGLPSAHVKGHDFQFNPRLLQGDYVLPKEAQAIVDAERVRVDADVNTLIAMARIAHTVFPGAFDGGSAERAAKQEDFRMSLACDPEPIVRFYSELDRPGAKVVPPPPERLTPEWMHFRWLQVKLLLSLDLASKYGQFDVEMTPATRHRLENYMMDSHYVMLGALEGGLATKDKWARETFARICPRGLLLPGNPEE